MSDLVARILDCVPAGTYALRTLFGLVETLVDAPGDVRRQILDGLARLSQRR